jgi:hypothetical protein
MARDETGHPHSSASSFSNALLALPSSGAQASFTFNGGVTIYGGFLISSATINGTTGTLFSGAQFGAAKAVVSGDVLLLTYTYNAASA